MKLLKIGLIGVCLIAALFLSVSPVHAYAPVDPFNDGPSDNTSTTFIYVGVDGNAKVSVNVTGPAELNIEAKGPSKVGISIDEMVKLLLRAFDPAEVTVNEP